MNRRLFLTGVGGVSLAAPFLPTLGVRPLRAQEAAAAPRRLVVFYTHNGCITNRWFPDIGGADGAVTPESLQAGTLAPLADKASKLLFPRGLQMPLNAFQGVNVNGVNHFDPHDQGMACKLTCAPLDTEGSHYALSHSFDHEVSERFNQGTNKSPLVLGVGFGSDDVKEVLSYSASRTPYLPETSAQNVYSGLTGLFTSGEQTEADYRVARGESVIDFVTDDLNTMRRMSMSSADQKKIDDWLDLLRATEQVVTPSACGQSAADALGLSEGSIPNSQFGGVSAEDSSIMLSLIALTMICDANRSLMMVYPGYQTYDFLGHTIDHHGLSHRVGSAATSGTCVSGVLDRLREIDEWFAGKFAELVNMLDMVQEGDVTMLDNSACMWLPELADGNEHNKNNLPIVIAGGCGGYLKQGVSVNVDGGNLGSGPNQTGDSESACQSEGEQVSAQSGTGSSGGNVPLNKLYVTLLNALGAGDPNWTPVDSFGVTDAGGLFDVYDFTTDANGNVTDGPGISDPGELDSLKA